jgi:hypothetical protein
MTRATGIFVAQDPAHRLKRHLPGAQRQGDAHSVVVGPVAAGQ